MSSLFLSAELAAVVFEDGIALQTKRDNAQYDFVLSAFGDPSFRVRSKFRAPQASCEVCCFAQNSSRRQHIQ